MSKSSKIVTHITIAFKFDCCPDENYWQITEKETGIVHRSRSYMGEIAHSFVEEKVQLRSGKDYIFTMYDKGSNGLQDDDSYYEIYSGIADDGWIQRALLGRVTGNFGFSLEHNIPIEYPSVYSQIELGYFQDDAHSTQLQNHSDLVVMFSVFTTFLLFGFFVGIVSKQRSSSQSNPTEPNYERKSEAEEKKAGLSSIERFL
jgi:hypothetical protein